MKSLKTLNNREKARLLHILFPEEMPGLLKFAREVAETLQNHASLFRQTWKNRSMSIDCWFELAVNAAAKIKTYDLQLNESSHLFAEQLFGELSAVFMIHCLRNYIISHKYSDPQLINAVNLLFNN